ncbi:hypothetical protein BU26DRAFT_335106 [Trematosphaeria pertusa]|uniref:F-box domain-containing protein n=1 Tax=Trematosphaeria pertusa TaxID=390896 RepID=A0A6A6IEH8_9PLEO|nr:uncharacterized protein BU26DRAFT_335106 [Trematosphaeria pertusa]KAF2248468.1 hypothetical protein BU26DRAFT_335106 [Trematosphaeria pertusa]
MPTSTLSLLNLPPELILEIGERLPPDGILSLKFTHSILNDTLPTLPQLKNRTLTNCARYAIERYRTPPYCTPSESRCILCKKIYPANLFVSSSSTACVPQSFEKDVPRPEIVELPTGVCSWHISSLVRKVRTGPNGKNKWESCIRKICLHCRAIEGWGEKCACPCQSCGSRMVRTYTRHLNNETECQGYHFWRNPAAGESADPREKAYGRLYVKETCREPDATEESTIDLPVHYVCLAECDAGLPKVC